MYALTQMFWGSYLITAHSVPENLSLLERAVNELIEKGKAPETIRELLHSRAGHIVEWPSLVEEEKELHLIDDYRNKGEEEIQKRLGDMPHNFSGTVQMMDWLMFMEDAVKKYNELKHPYVPEFLL